MDGKCLTANVIYRAAVTTEDDGNTEFYTGLTCRQWKKRLYEHTCDKNISSHRTATSLSGHIWSLKDRDRDFSTSWSILDRASPFNPVTRKCRLCLKEKFYIMYRPSNATINKRDEFWIPCRHRFMGLLS